MHKVDIKPVSVNNIWKGRRFKTPAYKHFEKQLQLLLPKKVRVPSGDFKVYYEFGVSNMNSDYDNPVKPFQDVLQKRYRFNDCRIVEATIRKVKTRKGKEYIKFKFSALEQMEEAA